MEGAHGNGKNSEELSANLGQGVTSLLNKTSWNGDIRLWPL